MAALAVVEGLDVLEHRGLELVAGRPRAAVDELLLERGEERFGDRVRHRLRLRLMASVGSELSVTYPFHPWCGREFVFVVARRTWGEDRVFFLDVDGVQRSLPRAWTDPIVRGLFRLGLPAPGIAILETIGRKSGEPRRNPVTNGLDDGVFWIVAEHGRRASYVRNIEASPRVRVRVGRRWHQGTARVVPDDPRELRYINSRRSITRLSTATVRLLQTDLMTIRIDLN